MISSLLVGIQPPNEQNLWTVLGAFAATAVVWLIYERGHFRGPPQGVLDHARVEPDAAESVRP